MLECQNWLVVFQLLHSYNAEMLRWVGFLVRWHKNNNITTWITVTKLVGYLTKAYQSFISNFIHCHFSIIGQGLKL